MPSALPAPASKPYHSCSAGPEEAFAQKFPHLPLTELAYRSLKAKPAEVAHIIRQGNARTLEEFALLISPAALDSIESLAHASQRITQQFYGKTIRLFAPLYLSNECINICKYCGFSRNNSIPRITIPVTQVVDETAKLSRQGFRSLLLVAGEHPKYVSNGYVKSCIEQCLRHMPGIAIELGPLPSTDYLPLVQAGAEALIVYQETYHQPTYEYLHTAGPKKHFAWRMDTPERGYAAGFRRLGIGALFGLYDWRYEALAVAAHAQHLLKTCWQAQVSISLPRMRPAAGGFQPDAHFAMSDAQLVQVIAALRMMLPPVGITLSTREPAPLRDGLMPLGITHMSAGACTEPGGYSSFDESNWSATQQQPAEQFTIADNRSPKSIAAKIKLQGYEPVWKDFDQALASAH